MVVKEGKEPGNGEDYEMENRNLRQVFDFTLGRSGR